MNNIIKTTFVLIIITIMGIGCFGMTLSPMWNGEIPETRNQYEETALSFKEGHLWLNHEVDSKLLELENPYDPDAREAIGAQVEWDHAYYDGHYYMYFGVVPVILLFLPYLLITGTPLLTTHGTMIFYCLGVIGLAFLFSFIRKKIFKDIPSYIFLLLYISSCCMSFWLVVDYPALYCTAVSSGICLEVWAMYFVLKSIYDDNLSYKLSSVYLVLGSFSGAAVFGCRPPIGIASVLPMIPLFIILIKQYKANNHSILSLSLKTILPYAIIAILLMWYNYARFENFFEFGLSYMMTVADLSGNSNILNSLHDKAIIRQIINVLFSFPKLSKEFPYISFSGIIFEFPILLCILIFLSKSIRSKLKDKGLLMFTVMIIVSFFVTILIQLSSTPFLYERYKSDFYYLLSILCFIIIGACYETVDKNHLKIINISLCVLCILTIIGSSLLFMVPHDYNFTRYYPEVLETLQQIFP